MEYRQAREHRLAYEVGLAFLAIVSVGIGAYEFLHPRTQRGFTWLDWVDLAIVAVFVADFVMESRRCGSMRRYARENWWEIPSLIPITGGMIFALEGYGVVRALRLARLVRVLRIVRLAGVAARLRSNADLVARVTRRSRAFLILAFGGVVVFLGSIAIFLAERHANEALADYGDAVWWSLNMFTNVAYVDFQPATATGRLVAAALEVMGIAFIGVFAASVTNALLKEES